jgi:hypothetical protein
MKWLFHFIFCFLTIAAQAAGGDIVYSYDTLTGEVSQKEVTATFVRESNHLRYLTAVDENGYEQNIETIDEHPFWVVNKEAWGKAKDLREGDVFIGANGELSCLAGKERVEYPAGITVYNFTVDGNHDYYVIAETGEYGQICVLVHNANCGGSDSYVPKARDRYTNNMKSTHIYNKKDMEGEKPLVCQRMTKGIFTTLFSPKSNQKENACRIMNCCN